MQVYVLLPLALFASLTYQGACEESTAQASSDGAASSASVSSDSAHSDLSREKRATYNMMRLGRGLHMLRLGKRGGAMPQSEEELDTLLNLLAGPNGELPEYPLEFDDGDLAYPYDEFESPVHPRYRRSTPPSDGVVAPEVLQKGSSDLEDIGGDSPLDEEDDGYYGYYPDDYLYGDFDEYLAPEEEGLGAEKRALSMLRLGKRGLSMLRLGKRDGEDGQEWDKKQDENLNEDFENDDVKRALSMLRLGKRPMSMLRLGKRPMSMLRLGKRPMSMLRLGKRPMSMLRLGKRPMSMLRLGKRPMSMLRLGKRPMSMLRLGKRPMSMLRLGKRPMSMLRLGKRQLSMLRLGKREDDEKEKKSLSMLRLGKRSTQ